MLIYHMKVYFHPVKLYIFRRSADLQAPYLRSEVSLQPRVSSEPELWVRPLQSAACPPLVPEWCQDDLEGRAPGHGDGPPLPPGWQAGHSQVPAQPQAHRGDPAQVKTLEFVTFLNDVFPQLPPTCDGQMCGRHQGVLQKGWQGSGQGSRAEEIEQKIKIQSEAWKRGWSFVRWLDDGGLARRRVSRKQQSL